MNLNVSRKWLFQMAENEGNGIFSVAGLVVRIKAEAIEASKEIDIERCNSSERGNFRNQA